ncbi:glycosyltransferase family 2 protein [Actinomycetospora aeridis]|uniref:Glycosyltransferase n=1 Tax=Actinomycetospora aeridis TaxID=3129231 RepID=A0ABU8NC07_9PSEU
MLTSIIVVCTHGRPGEVRELADLLAAIRGHRDVLVVDSSPDDATATVCRSFLFVRHQRSDRASLAYQRNRGIETARASGVEIVHFIDDDSRPPAGYFEALEDVFATTDVAGVGGVLHGGPGAGWQWLKRLFQLDGPRPGAVLPSGRPTLGHLRGQGGDASWLPGFAMSYRLAAIGDRRFDERLTGSSFGEDMDFSFRLAREHRLHLCAAAWTRHDRSSVNRVPARRFARHRTAASHRWVVENREHGMRRSAFWWSLAGETGLRVAGAVLGRAATRGEHRAVAQGNLDGARDILRGRVTL